MKIKSTLFMLLLSAATIAQENKDRTGHELHFGLRSIAPIATDLSYKKPRKRENKYFKIELVNLRFSTGFNSPLNGNPSVFNLSSSLGLELGWEKRKVLGSKLTFYRGINVGYVIALQYDKINVVSGGSTASSTTLNHVFYVPYTFGLMMNLSNHWLLSAEINPTVVYRYNHTTSGFGFQTISERLGFGFSPLSGLLMLGYRF